MARRRFFVDAVRGGSAEIAGDDARHLTRVLRVEAGQRFEISDNAGVYLAEVTEVRKERVVFNVVESLPPNPLPVRLILCAALIKFDHFEWMIEKATELGVERVVPVRAARTERGLDQAAAKRTARWRRVAFEAAQQSRRDTLPEIDEVAELGRALELTASCRFVCDESSSAMPILDAVPAARDRADTVALLIGPEGGWTDSERESFAQAGWTPVSLGPLILRAETAAMTALAITGAAWQTHGCNRLTAGIE
jgi:16S rRNA (uracil1498-N3)-methyltransferase